jgi:type III pantothenate kinase
MLLAFDIGNTETTVGLFDGPHLRNQWRLTTNAPHTPDELRFTLANLIASAQCSPSNVTAVVIASVVPPATSSVVEACQTSFGVTPIVVGPLSPLPITLEVDEPRTVGADRIVNTLAASQLYRRDAIVVDLGTATTYDCITAQGAFLGGIIQPGVITSSENLVRKTSQLPATGLTPPTQAIGKNTVDCIRSGVMYGTADSIDGLIRRLKKEWPTEQTPYVIATGGLATTFHSLCQEIDETDPALTLKGLQIAHSILA